MEQILHAATSIQIHAAPDQWCMFQYVNSLACEALGDTCNLLGPIIASHAGRFQSAIYIGTLAKNAYVLFALGAMKNAVCAPHEFEMKEIESCTIH